MKNHHLLLLMLTMTLNANSQTTLVTEIEAAGGASPPPTAYQINEISLNLDGLKQVPDSLMIDFPDNTSTVVPSATSYQEMVLLSEQIMIHRERHLFTQHLAYQMMNWTICGWVQM